MSEVQSVSAFWRERMNRLVSLNLTPPETPETRAIIDLAMDWRPCACMSMDSVRCAHDEISEGNRRDGCVTSLELLAHASAFWTAVKARDVPEFERELAAIEAEAKRLRDGGDPGEEIPCEETDF